MKVLVPVLPIAALSLLAPACASAGSHSAAHSPMPAWTPAETVALPALAPRADHDDDAMRVPRKGEPEDIWPASGLYVGGSLITSQPLGDFDGDLVLVGPTDLVLVPDLDVGAGASGYLSYRWHMNELMVQYSITENDGDFDGSPQDHDTTFYDLDLNWRHYFWEKSPLQPYGLLGIGWSRAKIENGTTDQATQTIFADAELENGINVNVGVGAALYVLPWVVVFGQGMYRFVRFETSDGLDGHFSNSPDVDGDSWNISFGAALRVLRGRD